MKLQYLANCNEMQKKAIMHESGPAMCLAGPGSGKTFVLTHRIKYLIEELSIAPSKILVITFSKAAAKEMQQRFYSIMGNQNFPVTFGTFHAIFFHMLCQHQNYSANSIISLQQKKYFLKMAIAESKTDFVFDKETIEDILQKFSYIKNSGENDCFLEIKRDEFDIKALYSIYQRILSENRKLDFDDMMLLCHKMLTEHPQILSYYQNQYQYVLIDEYQDINPIQYDMIKKLILPERNLFVVGDDDQSIYGFRGSDPSIMLRFKQDFPDGVLIAFPINYRSTGGIVKAAGRLILKNKNRYQKEFKANVQSENGVRFYEYVTVEEQQAEILNYVKEKKREGSDQRCAILLRTNLEASFWAELFTKERIPYRMKEKMKHCYDSFICRDLLCYLRLSRGSSAVSDLVTVMNRPLRYISRGCLKGTTFSFDEIKQFYHTKPYMLETINQLEYQLKWLSKMDLYAAINFIRKGIGYEDYLKTLAVEQNASYEKWLETLDALHQRMSMFQTVSMLEHHIDEYTSLISKQRMEDRQEGITIMTYHASKGLEFDEVILPSCNEGYTPHKKAIGDAGIEEERRLFYVAMTRAKKLLHICYIKGNHDRKHLISRFVKEIKQK